MHTSDLHALIVDRGITLGGKNPMQALLATYRARQSWSPIGRAAGRCWSGKKGQSKKPNSIYPPRLNRRWQLSEDKVAALPQLGELSPRTSA